MKSYFDEWRNANDAKDRKKIKRANRKFHVAHRSGNATQENKQYKNDLLK